MSFAFRIACSAFLLACLIPLESQAKTLTDQLAGRILLQVQSRGEAWYVDPVAKQRYYLGQAEDAYRLMRAKGLGIRHADLVRFQRVGFPARLAGRILLDVEAHGEAYYIIPATLRGVYLGRAADAYALMRQYGLGISNTNLATIPSAQDQLASIPAPAAPSPSSPSNTPIIVGTAPSPTISAIEQIAFNQINAYRLSKGLAALNWNADVANVARLHSQNMAEGRVPFGHDGFEERADLLEARLRVIGLAENVAYNDYPDPSTTAVESWIESTGHRRNIENATYTQTGMGVALSSDGAYYFTQLFTTF